MEKYANMVHNIPTVHKQLFSHLKYHDHVRLREVYSCFTSLTMLKKTEACVESEEMITTNSPRNENSDLLGDVPNLVVEW